MKAVLIILDSVGIGSAPDAAAYGDQGAATLPHLAAAVGGIKLPTMQKMGLGNIPTILPLNPKKMIEGVPPEPQPIASWGAMREMSDGKDTITGHWEIAGLEVDPGFHNFPRENSFPPDLIANFEKETGRKLIGNKAASGTEIIEELGEEHMRTGALICYTSADSVFQVAAHEEIVPVPELYRYCEIARRLCDPLRVGRVIARPFIGQPGSFKRTENRKDFAYRPDEPTILERLVDNNVPVYAVGKIEDIFAHRGITESVHTGNNADSQAMVEKWTREKSSGFIIANFIDYDMLYGHRRDAKGYARSLEQTDQWLATYLPLIGPNDMLMLTADHGNDPTFEGTDHTREYVPLLVYRPGEANENLGIRRGFYDIAQSLAKFFSIPAIPRGASFV
ncbi:MAG TPA: phosphopentomutase [Kiritimatiellia bacterium]|jgi:phosphopentomutase|nr:phosphopentomutase [Lentisphaerota bacterium]HRV30652.1 phosphopentomutase [Kiritimatiellia bacterium]